MKIRRICIGLYSIFIYNMESNNIQEYRCIYCNYAFTTYISKTSHEEKGKCKDKKYICNKCNARFTTPAGLSKHTCGKVYECERCKRKFKRENDLRMHKEKQTAPCQKEYECYECGYKCKTTTQLKKHTLFYCNIRYS